MFHSHQACNRCSLPCCLPPLPRRQAKRLFSNSLDGNWSGKGTVKVRTNSSPINVTCTFNSDATETSLSLDGNCRGLVDRVARDRRRPEDERPKYTGSYVGSGTGTAGLSGSRSGNAINLGIRWAKEVNGDRKAQMTVEKIGENGMRLTTVDVDPETGKNVVTSQINLASVMNSLTTEPMTVRLSPRRGR